MTSAAVHWLTGTTHLDVGDVLDLVHEVTDGADFVVKPGRWMYGKRYVTVEGIEVLAEPDPRAANDMPPVCVNVPGSGCELLGAERLRRLAAVIEPTRIDFAWDGVPFTVQDVAGWVRDGSMRTRIRSARVIEGVMGPDGNTVSLGSRQSTAEVVVYDRRGPVRLELRLRKERAAAAYDVLMAPPTAWSGHFAALLRGLVDFCDRSQASRADRAPLLPSWETFVGAAHRVVVALAGKVAPSLDRAAAWLYQQVSRTLHMAVSAGVDVRDVLREGRRRMTAEQEVRMRGWLNAPPGWTPTAGCTA